MDSRVFRKQGTKVGPFWWALLVLIFSLLLAACGDATATASSVSTPTNPVATATTAVSTTATSTVASTATTTQAAIPAAPGSNVTSTTAAVPAVYHPVINFSSASVTVGGSLTVSGEGYPATLNWLSNWGQKAV